MKNKKGIMLGEAFGAVLTLVLIGLLVIVSIYLFVTLSATTVGSFSVVNETGNVNPTGYSLRGYASNCSAKNFVITKLYNASSGAEFNTNNVTVNAVGYVTNRSVGHWLDSAYISYTFDQGGRVCTASNTMVTQFGTFPALIGLVGTIIFLALVIGVLVTSFIFNRKKGA